MNFLTELCTVGSSWALPQSSRRTLLPSDLIFTQIIPQLLSTPPRTNFSPSMWQHFLSKRHVRVQTHETISLCLATQSQAALMGFNRRGQGQEQGLQCMMPLIHHGKQTRLWCPCDPGVWGSHGSTPPPLMDTFELSWVWEEIANLSTGKCAVQSNSTHYHYCH